MNEERIIRNMRHMAWERAQGELKSMLHTFWDGDDQYKDLDMNISNQETREDFIKNMAREIVIHSQVRFSVSDVENLTKQAMAKAAVFYDECEKINFDELPKIARKKSE